MKPTEPPRKRIRKITTMRIDAPTWVILEEASTRWRTSRTAAFLRIVSEWEEMTRRP